MLPKFEVSREANRSVVASASGSVYCSLIVQPARNGRHVFEQKAVGTVLSSPKSVNPQYYESVDQGRLLPIEQGGLFLRARSLLDTLSDNHSNLLVHPESFDREYFIMWVHSHMMTHARRKWRLILGGR